MSFFDTLQRKSLFDPAGEWSIFGGMISKVLENIRLERERQGITQAEMAERMDMSLTSFGNFERGRTKTTQEKIEKAAAVLGKSYQSLMMGYDVSGSFEGNLEEIRSRDTYYKSLLAEKDREITELRERLSSAMELAASREKTIGALEAINRLYAKRIPEKD